MIPPTLKTFNRSGLKVQDSTGYQECMDTVDDMDDVDAWRVPGFGMGALPVEMGQARQGMVNIDNIADVDNVELAMVAKSRAGCAVKGLKSSRFLD